MVNHIFYSFSKHPRPCSLIIILILINSSEFNEYKIPKNSLKLMSNFLSFIKSYCKRALFKEYYINNLLHVLACIFIICNKRMSVRVSFVQLNFNL